MAPRKAMTVLIFVRAIEIVILTIRMMRVHIAFFAFVSGVPINSSIESFVGKTQNGVAKSTTTQMPKSEIYRTIGVFVLSGK